MRFERFEPMYINVLGKTYEVDTMATERWRNRKDTEHITIEAHRVESREFKETSLFDIKKVIYSNPATIVLWADGTKTVVKCGEEDVYDYQTGLLMCIAKKAFGNKGKFNDILRKWEPEEEEEDEVTPEIRKNFEQLARSGFNSSLSYRVYGGKADE